MNDRETKKVYLQASIAALLAVVATVMSYDHNIQSIISRILVGVIVYILVLVVTSSLTE